MKRIIIFLILIVCSCNPIERSPKPDPFFDKEQMATIMTDVYLIESSISSNRKSFINLGVLADEYIYEKHHIDSTAFKDNFNYYADRVDDYMEVLEIVEKKLTVVKDSINKHQEQLKKDAPQEMKPVSTTNTKLIDSAKLKLLDYKPSQVKK